MPGKTPQDQHLINQMMGYASIKTNDLPTAAKAMEAQIDDGMTPPAEISQDIKALSEIHYQLKNYDKAIEFGNRAIKGGFADEGIKTIVGQSYYLKDDYKATQKFEESQVDQVVKAGETPKNDQLTLLCSACQKADDDACTAKALEKHGHLLPQARVPGRSCSITRAGAKSPATKPTCSRPTA